MAKVDINTHQNVTLECSSCKQGYNASALLDDLHQIIPGPGDSAYEFICECCTDGEPSFKHVNKTWLNIASTALFNLERAHKSKFFHIHKEVCTFIAEHWDELCVGRTKTPSWKTTLSSQFTAHPEQFEKSPSDNKYWALRTKDLEESNDNEFSRNNVPDKDFSENVDFDEPEMEESEPKKKSQTHDKQAFMWCHQCKQKHSEVVYCSRTCSKKYCTRCVWRHYRERVEEIEKEDWVCYYCQGICSCAFCRRRRAKETNTEFESHRGKKRGVSENSSDDNKRCCKKRKTKATTEECKRDRRRTQELINVERDEQLNTESTPDQLPCKPDAARALLKVPKVEPKRSLRDSATHKKSIAEFGSTVSKRVEHAQTKVCVDPQPNSANLHAKLKNSGEPISVSNIKEHSVTLKDLIDAQILEIGGELCFPNMEHPGKLVGAGHVLWGKTIYQSLSTFAKKVITESNEDLTRNCWHLIFCNGKSLDYYRKQYFVHVDKKLDEVQESSGDEEESDGVGSEVDGVGSEAADSDSSPMLSIRDSFHAYHMEASASNSQRQQYFDQKEENFETDFTTDKVERWWTVDSDEESCDSSPIYEDPLLFSASPNSVSESEQDVLVMGSAQTDQFLDIRDKDFFNVAGYDEIHGFSKSSTMLNKMELINNSLSEVLDNLSLASWEETV